MGVLRDYIAYAKANFQPTLTDSASQRLISAYVDMRKVRAVGSNPDVHKTFRVVCRFWRRQAVYLFGLSSTP